MKRIAKRALLIALAASLPAVANAQRMFVMPERVGVVQQVSVTPPALFIDGVRFNVAPDVVITADGWEGEFSLPRASGMIVGRQVAHDADEGSGMVNRLHIIDAADNAATDAVVKPDGERNR